MGQSQSRKQFVKRTRTLENVPTVESLDERHRKEQRKLHQLDKYELI